MIELRIDTDALVKTKTDVLASIYMVQAFKEAGVPIVGTLIAKGLERGSMTWLREDGLDGDEWVIRWFDDEEGPMHRGPVEAKGRHALYSWTRYRNLSKPIPTTDDEDDEL